MKVFKRIVLSLSFGCLLLFLLAGCGGSTVQNDTGEIVERVLFSNIKFSDSELSDQEEKMMTDVQNMLAAIRVIPGEDSYYVEMLAENTTPYDLRISFYLQQYDSDGVICGSSTFFLDEWKSGARLDKRMSVSGNSEKPIDDVRISAEFVNGSSWYRTDMIKPVYEARSDEDSPVHVQLKQELPYSFSVQNYSGTQLFTLTDFSVTSGSSSGYYILTMKVHKDSALTGDYTSMEYRLLREDGVIVTTGSANISYLDIGETMLVVDDYLELEPGNYTFEILSGN